LRDINTARKIIETHPYTVAIVKEGNIIFTSKKNEIKSILFAIEKFKDELAGAVVGCNLVSKAAAFLCRYQKIKGVYSPRGTKTGIALLIMGGIPCQVDEMIQNIAENEAEYYPFDQALVNVESPEEAYSILKKI